jgi:putative tryptophan/tyrosine transport system substrate-binding protein
MEVIPVNVRDAAEIERGITAFAHSGNTGLIVTGSPLTALHRNLIIALAAQHKLPAVYATRFFVSDGGLISYGTNLIVQHRKAAGYVDRILKGEKPADLPVQTPTCLMALGTQLRALADICGNIVLLVVRGLRLDPN